MGEFEGVIGAGTDGFVYNPPHVRTPANRKVTRSRGGKSPRPQRSLAESVAKAEEDHKQASGQEPVAATSGEEEKKTEAGKRRKEKKQYVEADFKFAQPLLKRQPFKIVYRSRKWFNKHHPLVEFKRDDPHKEERVAIQAAKKAAIERGEEVPQKRRKQPVKAGSEGCTTRMGCALNDLYNLKLEWHTRTGRCDYCQDFGHKANTARVGFGARGAMLVCTGSAITAITS